MDPVTITPYRDGPLLVRGPVELVGADGEVVVPRRRTVALCRCGGTGTPPWCDGTHKVIERGLRRRQAVAETASGAAGG